MFLRLLFIALTFFAKASLMGQTIGVMSYNIRYDNTKDEENSWPHRKDELAEMILNLRPGILGIQEGLYRQVDYLDKNLSGYSYVGVGREDGKQAGEFSAVFYDTTVIDVIREGTFWLSETSDKVSVGWDAALERICTYGLFKYEKSGEQFWIFNTHFDHKGERARENSSQLILEKIAMINDNELPVILMGDFNSTPNQMPIQMLTSEFSDPLLDRGVTLTGPVGTFQGFEAGSIPENRIDYVLTKNLNCLRYSHVDTKRTNGLNLSDHLPVLVEVSLASAK